MLLKDNKGEILTLLHNDIIKLIPHRFPFLLIDHFYLDLHYFLYHSYVLNLIIQISKFITKIPVNNWLNWV